VRAIVWVGLCILALNVLFVGLLVFVSLARRVQIARTRRELERLGFVVTLPSAHDARPIWPRLLVGLAGFVALIVTTSVMTAAPSARTLAASGRSSFEPVSSGAAAARPVSDPASVRPAAQEPTSGGSVPHTKPPVPSTSAPANDPQTDAGAPSTVAAVPTSATAIHLEWAAVSDATGYEIERSTDSVRWSPLASIDGEQTAYTDGPLDSGTTYYYRVAAVVDGESAPTSDAVSATTTVVAPTAPLLLSATGSATAIDLEWSDVGGESGYRIERSVDGTTWTSIGTTGQGVTSYTDAGLASAATFSYRIVAFVADAESPASGVLSATTDAVAPSTTEADGSASEAPAAPKASSP
jgi:Fibronectin type III domain